MKKQVQVRKLVINEIENILSKKMAQKEALKDKRDKVEKEIIESKQILEDTKDQLFINYHNYLTQGIDTRREGLSWMIKAIWKLGRDVILTELPKFLDEGLIKYLFEVKL